jgi:hypothetical protein
LALFFFAFFLVAMDLFSLSILHGIYNGVLLQLVECILSTQNEVKRKMIETGACNAALRSHARLACEEKLSRDIASHRSVVFSCHGVVHIHG